MPDRFHDDDIRPDERELVGQWLDTGTRLEGDGVSARIDWLVRHRLEAVATAADGSLLLRDPRDGRLWELTHPYPFLPGGGPPRLATVDSRVAADRYGTSQEGRVRSQEGRVRGRE